MSKENEKKSVLIIGAGPAGLAVAGRLSQYKVPFTILEQSTNIANSWEQHYDRLCLHTVKQFSSLPHLDFPRDYPIYVPKKLLISYYKEYAKTFEISPIFNSKVVQIKREDSQWTVLTDQKKKHHANKVVVATGTNRIPNIPKFKDQDLFEGEIIHSRFYKNPRNFESKKVLVIGMGNTGAEISLDLANHGIETYLSVRGPVNVIPRDLNGRPVQLTAKILNKLPFGLGNWIGAKIRDLYFGDLSKYGLERSKLYPIHQLQQTGKTPVIDIGTVELIKDGKIKVVSEIDYFTRRGLTFTSGESLEIDSVILATGYRSKLEEFIPGIEKTLDQYSYPKEPVCSGEFKGMYFIGFDNYKLGGILGTIKEDSLRIVEDILG